MNISLMILYEPASARQEPVPLARVQDPKLAVLVAHSAVAAAEERASELESADGYLGEVERAEVERLRRVLTLLVPGFRSVDRAVTAAITQ